MFSPSTYESDNDSGISAQERLAAMEGLDRQIASDETLARRAEEDFQVSIS